MSDTPRADAAVLDEHDPACAVGTLCHQLERELTAAQADVDKWREEYNRMRRFISKQNEDISQTCGKALGYPWFKDDQKNFHGSTDAQGVCVGEHVAETIASELADAYKAAKEENAKLQERVKNLLTLGNTMADYYGDVAIDSDDDRRIEDWRKAAEECQ